MPFFLAAMHAQREREVDKQESGNASEFAPTRVRCKAPSARRWQVQLCCCAHAIPTACFLPVLFFISFFLSSLCCVGSFSRQVVRKIASCLTDGGMCSAFFFFFFFY